MKINLGYIGTILSLFIISGAASGDGISIIKLSSESIPFSEIRDPVNDSLYNVFDLDPATSALFSDFSVQFSVPFTADELKIINGNSRQFTQLGRLRDIEITLYTTGVIEDKIKDKSGVKKNRPKPIIKDKNLKNEKSKDLKDNNIPAKDKLPGKQPEIEDKKNDSESKNSGELTALSTYEELQPVTGILNNPLAEEPGKPVSSDSEEMQKDKTDIRDTVKTSSDKKNYSEKKTPANKKKPSAKKEKKTVTDKKKTSLPAVSAKKEPAKKNEIKKEPLKADFKKENKPAKDDIPFKKMEGLTRIENDSEGRVIINVSLKDIPREQSIKFGSVYTIAAMEIRKRDDSNYAGSSSELPYISGINFYNKGKQLTFQGLEPLKKGYEERFVKALDASIADKIYSAFDQDKELTRVFFKKNGKIEYRDRYKCLKKNDPDCTSAAMPDMWMIRDGRLYMRFMNDWIPWKYELEYTPEFMNGAESESDSRQWLKLYYKKGSGFSENFLYLEKSDTQRWGWE